MQWCDIQTEQKNRGRREESVGKDISPPSLTITRTTTPDRPQHPPSTIVNTVDTAHTVHSRGGVDVTGVDVMSTLSPAPEPDGAASNDDGDCEVVNDGAGDGDVRLPTQLTPQHNRSIPTAARAETLK